MAQPVSPVIVGLQQYETKVAKNQPQYNTLPSLYINKGNALLTRWELTDAEIDEIIKTKSVYLLMETFGNPVTPVNISTVIDEYDMETIRGQFR